MRTNKGLKAYWKGYKLAKINGYMLIIENERSLLMDLKNGLSDTDTDSKQTIKGFIDGIGAIRNDLNKLIDDFGE